jgi:VCBS repeat-containing protein
MKKRIIGVSMALVLIAVMAIPMAAYAGSTTAIEGLLGDAPPSVTLNAPTGPLALTLVNGPSTARQIVAVLDSGSNGSVSVSNIGSYTYDLTVTANNSGKLTNGGEALTNTLMIATGQDGVAALGEMANAAGLASGAYASPGTKVVALTGSAQSIGSGLTATSIALGLVAFQKINAEETHNAGTYSLTLTYAYTPSW